MISVRLSGNTGDVIKELMIWKRNILVEMDQMINYVMSYDKMNSIGTNFKIFYFLHNETDL